MTPVAATDTTHTAAEIATALGRSRRAIWRALAHIRPSSQQIVAGNLAASWEFSALPIALRNDLEAVAQAKGYRNAEHLLSEPQAPWQPAIPLLERPQKDIDQAAKRRSVQIDFLQGKDTETRSKAQLGAAIAAEYKKHFGHTITPKGAMQLFERTVERDRNREDWERLEIYLDDAPGRKPGPGKPVKSAEYDHSALADVIKALENAADPTTEDVEFVFDAWFHHFEALNQANPGQTAAVKRSCTNFVFAAIPLSKSKDSLQRTFNAKYIQWVAGDRCPSALSDRRRLNSGNFRRPDFAVDAAKIRDAAILHGGNESLAHRLLRQRGKLSPEFCEHYTFDPRRDKSRVPTAVRAAITPQVEMCGPIHRGPWEAKMRGPYIQRDWSQVHPGQWFNADDVTWNSYFWYRDEDGQLQITRGECLLFIDLRTGFPLDFALLPGKYNGEHIRRAILRVHDLHGLPEKGFYFENGAWKSRLITGETSRGRVHWRDAEKGLRDYGLDMELRHARTPRAKTIEGLIHILQDRQRSEPGFVGFNERLEKMERVQDIIARCKRGKEDPRNHFLSKEQWRDRISQCLNEYLADPQNGKMLDGMTPAEMWAERQTPKKLPDDARYVLATHRVRVKVRQEGIILTIRGKRLAFYNEETGKRIGRDVFAFYNLEQPALLTVSNLDRTEFFTVKNHQLPAMSASKEQFAAVNKDRSGHMAAAKEIYGNIAHPERRFIVRDNCVDDETKALGRFHGEANARFHQEQSAASDAQTNRIKRGIELLRETSAATPPAAETKQPKTYVLHPASGAKATTGVYWALWGRVDKIKPGISRHALTQKTLGCHPKPQEMTPAQLAKMIEVFSAIIRDAKTPAATT